MQWGLSAAPLRARTLGGAAEAVLQRSGAGTGVLGRDLSAGPGRAGGGGRAEATVRDALGGAWTPFDWTTLTTSSMLPGRASRGQCHLWTWRCRMAHRRSSGWRRRLALLATRCWPPSRQSCRRAVAQRAVWCVGTFVSGRRHVGGGARFSRWWCGPDNRLSHTVMEGDNVPLSLPNGFVYGRTALQQMAADHHGEVLCPRTGQKFDLAQAERAYVG